MNVCSLICHTANNKTWLVCFINIQLRRALTFILKFYTEADYCASGPEVAAHLTSVHAPVLSASRRHIFPPRSRRGEEKPLRQVGPKVPGFVSVLTEVRRLAERRSPLILCPRDSNPFAACVYSNLLCLSAFMLQGLRLTCSKPQVPTH